MYDRHENMPLAQFLRAPLCLLGGASALANSQRASSSFGKYACTKLLSNNHPPQNNKYSYTRPRVVKNKKKKKRCSTRKKNCTAQISTYAHVCSAPRRVVEGTIYAK